MNSLPPERDVARSAARREFVRRHHPDVGGDTKAFVDGLAAFDRPADRPTRPTVTVYRSRNVGRVLGRTVRHARRRLARLPSRVLR